MNKSLFVAAVVVAIASISAVDAGCTPSKTTTYTTTDASILTSIAYISQFQLDGCKINSNLYAVVNEREVLQLGTSSTPNNYIVSWTKELAEATNGDHWMNIYDEEGIAQWKKKGSAAETVAKVNLNHPGAWSGPWLNSEHLAAAMGVVVGYLAISGKGRLLSG